MKTRLALVATAVAMISMAAAASAGLPRSGTIKEGVGVAGVNLGMTEAAAIKEWGKPNVAKCREVETTPYRSCVWSSGSGKNYATSSVLTRNKRVVHIYLFAGKWKTNKGVMYGTKLGKLKSAYPKVKFSQTCVLDRGYVGEIGSGKKVTSFRFTSKAAADQGHGIDSIVIYNSRKVGWDGADTGRPQNKPSCNRVVAPPRDEPPTTDPPADDPPPEPEPEPEPDPDPDPYPPEEDPTADE